MSINDISPYSVGYNDGFTEAASRQSRSKALLGELYACLCKAADIIISEYPTHDHRYKEAEGWIMNVLADTRLELNIKSPNAPGEGRGIPRTLDPIVGNQNGGE